MVVISYHLTMEGLVMPNVLLELSILDEFLDLTSGPSTINNVVVVLVELIVFVLILSSLITLHRF